MRAVYKLIAATALFCNAGSSFYVPKSDISAFIEVRQSCQDNGLTKCHESKEGNGDEHCLNLGHVSCCFDKEVTLGKARREYSPRSTLQRLPRQSEFVPTVSAGAILGFSYVGHLQHVNGMAHSLR